MTKTKTMNQKRWKGRTHTRQFLLSGCLFVVVILYYNFYFIYLFLLWKKRQHKIRVSRLSIKKYISEPKHILTTTSSKINNNKTECLYDTISFVFTFSIHFHCVNNVLSFFLILNIILFNSLKIYFNGKNLWNRFKIIKF